MIRVLAIATMLLVAVAAASPARAGLVVLPVSSYDMQNGDGTAQFGSFNYWDGTYNGSGNKTTSHAPLTGGTGALTDGTIATQRFDFVSNSAGTGQYVGWKYFDPTITFHFPTLALVYTINLYVDGSHVGLVGAPQTITVNGQDYNPIVVPIGSMGVQQLIVALTNPIALNQISIQLHPGPFGPDAILYNQTYPNFPIPGDREPWMMLSEVQFNGVSAVPELSTWLMMLLGFAGIGFMAYRRRSFVRA
jgi:hypothetical protein